MKDWFWNLWQDIKDDPFGFILELLIVLLLIFALFVLIVLFYGVCTGQITSRGGKNVHGIKPMYIGKNLIFIPY